MLFPPFIRQLVFWCYIHLFVASCLGAAVRESNMTLWLRFDEKNGTEASDSSGKDHTGTLFQMDDEDWVEGKFGNALHFDGVDDFVGLGNATSLGMDAPSECSFSAWIKLDQSGNYPMIFTKAGGAGVNFRLNTNSRLPTLRVGNVNHAAQSHPVPLGEWHHVVITYHDANNQGVVYLDGAKTSELSIPQSITTAGEDAFVGKRSDGYYFPGSIDDLRVYDVVLSEEEVTEVYGDGLGDLGPQPVLSTQSPTAARTAPVTLEFRNFNGPVDVEGFESDSLDIKGGELESFWKTSASSYLFDVRPDDPLGVVTLSMPKGRVHGVDGQPSQSVSLTIDFKPKVTSPDMLGAWWPLDKDVDGWTPDIIGSYDLQFQEHEAEDLSTAKFGNGVTFDGSGEHLLRNSSGSLLSTSYTLSVWAKLNTVSLQDIFVADQHGVLFEVQADSRLRFLHRSPPGSKPDDNVFTGNEIKANEWMHLVAVRDSDGKTMKMYVNGSEAASQETTREPMGDRNFSIVIGRLSVNNASRALNGQLDDLRIYKSALSTETVGKIYGDGEGDLDHGPIVTLNGDGFLRVEVGTVWDDPGANATDVEDGNLTNSIVKTYQALASTDPRAPMARWSFNGDAKDLSGNANDATLVGDTAFVDAKFGQGIELDNEGDYAEVVAISGASNTSTLSVSAWIKIKSFGTGSLGDGGILTTSISSNPLLLWVNYDAAGNNNPSLSFNIGNAVLDSNRVNGPAEALKVDQWHHVVGVLDGASRKIYVDGEMKAEVTNGSTEPTILERQSLRIGSWFHTPNFDFDGVIDEVRLYDVSLTQEEVTALHTWDGEVNDIDFSQPGLWRINYEATDSSGTKGWARRIVQVVEPGTPVIVLNGDSTVTHEGGSAYEDPGALVQDLEGNPIAGASVTTTGTVDASVVGIYSLTMNYTTESGKAANPVVRKVQVVDTTAPSITLNSPIEGQPNTDLTLYLGQEFADPGAEVTDLVDATANTFVRTPAINLSNLLAFWQFESLLEGKVTDSSGNNRDLNFKPFAGKPSLEDGKLGRCFDFDASGGHFHLSPDEDFRKALEGDCTLSLWGFSHVAGASLAEDIAYLYDIGDSHGQGLGLLYNRSHNLAPGGSLATYRAASSANLQWAASGEWFHAAVVVGQAEQKLYLNGELQGTAPAGEITLNPNREFRVGAESKALQRFWNGKIDEFAVWGMAMSDRQVTDIYEGNLDTNQPGEYQVWYGARDASGNHSQIARKIIVALDPSAPKLELLGDPEVTHEAGTDYVDAGVKVLDAEGLVIADAEFSTVGLPDGKALGSFTVSYGYEDSGGRIASAITRKVIVVDTTPPLISVLGEKTLHLSVGSEYTDPGASATDGFEGELRVDDTTQIPVLGLVFHWSFDEIDGSLILDSSPNTLHGSLEGVEPAVAIIEGKYGQALSLNGSGAYVHLAHSGKIDPLEITASCWFRSEHDGDWYQNLFGKYGYSPGTPFWGLGWMGPRQLGFCVRDILNVRSTAQADVDWGFDGEWHHLAGVRANGKIKFYGDGVLLSEVDDKTGDNRNDRPLSLGRHSNKYFPAQIDEVRLYNRGLPAAQIAILHSGGGLDTSKAGEITVTYETFDSSGNTATDERKVIITDEVLPQVRLLGDAEVTLEAGSVFNDPGAVLVDADGEQLPDAAIKVDGKVDSMNLGVYTLSYGYIDAEGRSVLPVLRRVTVVDTTPPVITSNWGERFPVPLDGTFEDPGVTVIDNLDTGEFHVKTYWRLTPTIAHWDFDDDGMAVLVKDLSGNGHHGSLVGSAERVSNGKIGQGVRFSSSGARMEVSDDDALDLSTFTLTAWLKAEDDAGTVDYPTLFSHGLNALQRNWWVAANKDGGVFWKESSAGQQLTLFQERANEAPSLKSGDWIHLACIRDETENTARIYMDGKQVGEKTGIPEKPDFVSEPVFIGAGENGGRVFIGTMDDVRIYGAALPVDEITEIYNGQYDPDTSEVRNYEYVYHVRDSSGNLAEFILTVVVTEDLEPPVINLVGEAQVVLEVGGVYEDEGATALDVKDGNLTPFIDDGGTLDAVDTSQVGEYIIRYNVADMSGNRAVEVVRKVIVGDPEPEDAFSQFLEGLPEADRAPDADPDGDRLANLLEYAFGGDPSKNSNLELPTAKREGGSLEILLVRLKPAQDADITIKIESIDKLGDLWEEVTTPVKGAIDGVSQDNLPDDKPFANSHYERIKLVVPLDRAAQFFRVTVER